MTRVHDWPQKPAASWYITMSSVCQMVFYTENLDTWHQWYGDTLSNCLGWYTTSHYHNVWVATTMFMRDRPIVAGYFIVKI